eukprot:gene6390-12928_t
MESYRKFDITSSMAQFFDIHMVNPLLDNLRDIGMYDSTEITLEKINSVSRTNMLELLEDEYERLPADHPTKLQYAIQMPAFEARKAAIFDKIDNEPEGSKRVTEFFKQDVLISDLKKNANLTLDYIYGNHGISRDDIEEYYKYSKFKYDCGNYEESEEMLIFYLMISQPQNSSVLGALWGLLACRILQAKWDHSLADLAAVKEAIESRNISPVDQIRQRGWLMHWGLFVYMNHKDGTDALVDFYAEKVYLQTLENLCPWLLRYFTVAVILSHRRRNLLQDVLKEIQSMNYQYSDPITEFLECLYDKFDFDEAQSRLKDCQVVMKNDFFLQSYADKFTHEARLLICEIYCTINRRVDLTMLAEKLELSEEEAEKWMVDMVRSATAGASVDAKIDSSGKQVIMSMPMRSAHQQVVDRTRDLTVRSGLLCSNLETTLLDQAFYVKNR